MCVHERMRVRALVGACVRALAGAGARVHVCAWPCVCA